MNKTKRVYINTVAAVILISLLFIDNLSSSDKAVATTTTFTCACATETLRDNTTTTTTGRRINATNATGSAISEIVNDRLENTTSALANATEALTNATNAFQGVVSNLPPNTSS